MPALHLRAAFLALLLALALIGCGSADTAAPSDGDTQDSADTDYETDVLDGDAESDAERSSIDGDTETSETSKGAPQAPSIPAGYSQLAIALELCPWRTACGTMGEGVNACFEDIYAWPYQDASRLQAELTRLECVRKATRCSEFHACMDGISPDNSGLCERLGVFESSDGSLTACDGSDYVFCEVLGANETPYISRDDCAQKGMACDKNEGCVSPTLTCAELSGSRQCVGDTAFFCDEGMSETDHAAYMMTCSSPNSTCGWVCYRPQSEKATYCEVGCAPKEMIACSQDYCQNGIAAVCLNGTYGLAVDCRGISPDFTCISELDTLRCALPEALVECTSNEERISSIRCQGTKASFCFAGKTLTMDCASIGGTCSVENLGCEVESDEETE